MGDTPIRLLLVDAHRAFRVPLAVLLNREPGLRVVAQAGSLAEARRLLADPPAAIDVVLIALALPDGPGVDVIPDLRRHHPAARLVVLTGRPTTKERVRAREAGAAGVIDQVAGVSATVAAIRRLAVPD